MKRLLTFTTLLFSFAVLAQQQLPVNCNLSVPGCTTPEFPIVGTNPAYNTPDFGTGTVSNPSSNPSSGNAGCLLSGETVSTFITINVVSTGTLEWSMIGLDAAGNPTNSGCYDWIMWNVTNQPPNNPCAGINGNTLPPVSCNWNGSCNANTGMSSPGNFPPGANSSSYEPPLPVTAGQTYILCLSNYSGVTQDVDLNFFGTANVACGVSAPDQEICEGSSTTVTIATPGYDNPQFTWLNPVGVASPNSGTSVVTPPSTTTYQVAVYQPPSGIMLELHDTATFTITVVPPPTPFAGNDQTVCLGDPIFLNGSVTNPSNPHVWSSILPSTTPPATATFSPNYSSLTPTVTVNQPGVYQFVWKETSAICGPSRDTVQVTVSDILLTATPVGPSCWGYSDGSITINSAGATEYSFDGGDNWQASNTQGGFATGNYSVCARNSLGCEKCINATVGDPVPVTVTVSNDTLICENGTATLVATGAAAPGATFVYHWSHTPSLAASQDVNPAANTTYTVVAENQSGCQSEPASINVTIRPPLSANITPDQYVCPGYPGTMTVTGSGGIGAPYIYTWSTGAADTSVSSTITDSPMTTTTYTVTIEDACESSPFVIGTQLIAHPLPVPQIAVDYPELCEPALFNVTNETDPAMSASTEWRLSDGQMFTDQDLVQPDTLWAGSYDVTLIVTSPDGCIDSTTFDNFLIVRPKPVADFKWSPDPITMFNTETLFQNYSFGANTYEWEIESGSPATSTSEDVVSVFPDGQTGHYTVTLWATSDLGCWDSIVKIVPVMPEILIYAPNTFTPDGDEFNQTWQVYMEGIDEYNFNLTIYNRWGEVIWESNDISQPWDGTYNGQIVPQGAYNWKIRVKDILTDKWMEYAGAITLIR